MSSPSERHQASALRRILASIWIAWLFSLCILANESGVAAEPLEAVSSSGSNQTSEVNNLELMMRLLSEDEGTSMPTPSPKTSQPSNAPSTSIPSLAPTSAPSTSKPSKAPSTRRPSIAPTSTPTSSAPSKMPTTSRPSKQPTNAPTSSAPSETPTTSRPSKAPTNTPTTSAPSKTPTTSRPSESPSTSPPSNAPSEKVTSVPSKAPSTSRPSKVPTTSRPSGTPSIKITSIPSKAPSTSRPSNVPSTSRPSKTPSTSRPSKTPSVGATSIPSRAPTTPQPSKSPTLSPTVKTKQPTKLPTATPTESPIKATQSPTTSTPSKTPTTQRPSRSPSRSPTVKTKEPTKHPTMAPTYSPTKTTKSPTGTPTASPTEAKRKYPSFVIMLADDLGYNDVGYNGGYAHTPNLDALAHSPHTVLLDNFHAGSSICSPSRASMLSGRIPERECIALQIPNNKGVKFRGNMPSIAKYVRSAGYATGLFGKWHLGERLPDQAGFDEFSVIPVNAPNFDPACFCPEAACKAKCKAPNKKCFKRKRRDKKCGSKLTKECHMGYLKAPENLGQTNWFCKMQSGGIGKTKGPALFPRGVTAGEHTVQLASEFIRRVPRGQSFLVEVWFNEPHAPFIASANDAKSCYNGTTCDPAIRDVGGIASPTNHYFASIAAMDRAVGRLINNIRTANRDMDTIIIFTSDNGFEDANGVIPSLPFRTLRGAKRLIYEGGTRVPGFIYWPGRITSHRRISQSTSMLDIFPTITSILQSFDGALPQPPKGDGESLLPLIAQASPASWVRSKGFLICQPVTAIHTKVCTSYAFYEGEYKVVIHNNKIDKAELYNVVTDSGEQQNLASQLVSLLTSMAQKAVTLKNHVLNEYKTYCPKVKVKLG